MVIPVIMMIIPATVTATMMTMPILDNWYRNEDWIVVPISFHFDDLCRRLVDDDLRFLWRFFGFVFFCDRGWRKHGGSNLPYHGFRPVGREAQPSRISGPPHGGEHIVHYFWCQWITDLPSTSRLNAGTTQRTKPVLSTTLNQAQVECQLLRKLPLALLRIRATRC
jgi:hypothetical protein